MCKAIILVLLAVLLRPCRFFFLPLFLFLFYRLPFLFKISILQFLFEKKGARKVKKYQPPFLEFMRLSERKKKWVALRLSFYLVVVVVVIVLLPMSMGVTLLFSLSTIAFFSFSFSFLFFMFGKLFGNGYSKGKERKERIYFKKHQQKKTIVWFE